MIKCIDKVNYHYPSDELEQIIYEKANEHYKKQINKAFSEILKIKTEKDAKVFAIGNVKKNEFKFKLDCDDIELSQQIQALFR